jgi:hypothetical protein
MNTLIIEFKNGRRISLKSKIPYKEAIRRINLAQILYDNEGLPIDLTNVKQIKPMED